MPKKEKLLISEAEVFYADAPKGTFTYKGVEVIYKPFLTYKERIEFVHSVADGCVTDKVYYPSMLDYFIRLTTIALYTNVTIPTGMKKGNNLAYGSGLFDELLKHINISELNGMIEAVKEEIAIRTKINPYREIIETTERLLATFEQEFANIDVEQMFKMIEIVSKIDEKKDIVRLFKSAFVDTSSQE